MARSAFWALSRPESWSTASSAFTIWDFCASSPPTKVSSWPTRSRIEDSLPWVAWLSSVVMTLSCATPPPLSSNDKRAEDVLDLRVARACEPAG